MFITRIVLAARKFRQWFLAQITFGFLNLLKLLPADPAIRFADWLVRKIGPMTGRHKLMLVNLANAFPEKSEAERDSRVMYGGHPHGPDGYAHSPLQYAHAEG